MIVKQGRFYLKHNTLSEDAPIAIIFKVKNKWWIYMMVIMMKLSGAECPVGGATTQPDVFLFVFKVTLFPFSLLNCLLIDEFTWQCYDICLVRGMSAGWCLVIILHTYLHVSPFALNEMSVRQLASLTYFPSEDKSLQTCRLVSVECLELRSLSPGHGLHAVWCALVYPGWLLPSTTSDLVWGDRLISSHSFTFP